MSYETGTGKPTTAMYQPFPELPSMTLRLFGAGYHASYPDAVRKGDLMAWYRFKLFREGLVQLMYPEDPAQLRKADNLARTVLFADKLPESLFSLAAGQGLTYHGEVEDTAAVHADVRKVRSAGARMNVVDLLYAVTQGEVPKAWQELHDQTLRLHGEVRGDI